MIHIVLLPKFKKIVITEQVANRIKELLLEYASDNQWKIEQLNINPEYIHVAMQLVLDESLSNVIGTLKFGSSKILKKEFYEINKICKANSFWRKYFCANTGEALDMELLQEFLAS